MGTRGLSVHVFISDGIPPPPPISLLIPSNQQQESRSKNRDLETWIRYHGDRIHLVALNINVQGMRTPT